MHTKCLWRIRPLGKTDMEVKNIRAPRDTFWGWQVDVSGSGS